MTCHASRLVIGFVATVWLSALSASGWSAGGIMASNAAVDAAWTLTIEPLDSPAADASSAPQLTAQGDRVILSWMERAMPRSLFKFSARTASGWSAAKTVASGNDLMINAADVPSVRALPDGSMAAAWMLANSPDPEAYDLLLAWSKDDGNTWSKPINPHHDRTETQHGFASLFPSAGGGLGLVWLDGRQTSAKLAKPTDNMSLRAATFNSLGKQVQDVAIDTRVCDCCPTSVAVTAEGPIVAFRNRSAKEVRDIYVSRFAAGKWTPPVAVHDDGWEIDACPVNGPAVAARARDVAVAWFEAVNDQGKTFVAFSRDAGRTFGKAVRVDDGTSTGHVDVEWLKDGAAVSWVEFAGQRSQFKVRRVDADGTRSASVTVAGTGEGRVAGAPRMAATGSELVFAWTETSSGASRVRAARARIPNS
jgi:hypothetical protein